MKVKLVGDINQCPSCKKVFLNVEAFDNHRTGDIQHRRCMSSKEMRRVGLSPRMKDGVWRMV